MPTWRLGALYVGTGLVTKEDARRLSARVEAGARGAAFPVAPWVREGERAAEGALNGRCLAAEERKLRGVTRDHRAQVLQRLRAFAVRCSFNDNRSLYCYLVTLMLPRWHLTRVDASKFIVFRSVSVSYLNSQMILFELYHSVWKRYSLLHFEYLRWITLYGLQNILGLVIKRFIDSPRVLIYNSLSTLKHDRL